MDQETHYEWLLRLVRTADRRTEPFDYRQSASGERRRWDLKREVAWIQRR